jgi:hypothetical protein
VEENEEIDSFISPLYRHTEARHYLEALDQNEKKEILKEAETWLISKLIEGEKR